MPPDQTSRNKRRAGLAVALAAACAVAAPVTQKWEGKRNRAYYDPSHIATVCWGHTGPEVRVGVIWTDGQCKDVFTADQQKLALAALDCTPDVVVKNKYAFGSVVDFVFNGGGGLYCKSSIVKNFRDQHYHAGCEAYLKYVYSRNRRTGQEVYLPGLANRRKDERAICLKGVA